MGLRFRRLTIEDAALTLKWRTDPEITKHMFTDLMNPSLESQQQWIKSLNKRDDYRAFMICDDDTPIGFLCFDGIDLHNQRCATGSYIYDAEARLKYALTLHSHIYNYAFHCLGLNKVVNYILSANEKVLKIQKHHQINLVGVLRAHVFKDGIFHDVYVFEQLKSEWHERKQHFPLTQILASFEN